MSAIFGILRFDGVAVNPRDLKRNLARMGKVLAHRMPDGSAVVIDGPVGLGHGLMRVTQEDRFDAQPLNDRAAGLALVADCRIDNREELAATFGLSAAALKDMPDSALVLRAYQQWGEDCASHLIGDFAFALWDSRAGRLVLARDHMGQRYVHYHLGRDFFAFATEIKGLWAAENVPRRLDDIAIAKNLLDDLNRTPGTTIFDGIRGLAGGTTLCVNKDGTATLHGYWQPRPDPIHLGKHEDYYVEHYRALLTEVVACRLRRLTRPAALCFSGGFDSGAIAALAGPVVTAQGRKLIAAASVMAEGESHPRDARAAVEACRRHLPHLDVHYYVRGKETVLTDLERSFLATDAWAGNNYVFRGLFDIATTAGARLMMDGHGGDYTLNYRAVDAWPLWLRAGRFTTAWREFKDRKRVTQSSAWQVFRFEVLPSLLPARLIDLWRALRRGGAPFRQGSPVPEALARRLIAEGRLDPTRLRGMATVSGMGRAWALRVLDQVRWRTRHGLALLAAPQGLDYTVPFHDKRIVEFSLAIPEEMHVKHGRSRQLSRRALAGLLPPEVLERDGPNDSQDPDFYRMTESIRETALQDLARLETHARIASFIDFTKLRRILTAEARAGDRPAQHRRATAIHALLVARFMEWFEPRNQ